MTVLIVRRPIHGNVRLRQPGLKAKASLKKVDHDMKSILVGHVEVQKSGLRINGDKCSLSAPVASQLRCLGVELIKLDDNEESFSLTPLCNTPSLEVYAAKHENTTVVDLSTTEGQLSYFEHQLASWHTILDIVNDPETEVDVVIKGFHKLAQLRRKKRIYVHLDNLSPRAMAIVWNRVPEKYFGLIMRTLHRAFRECVAEGFDEGLLYIRALSGLYKKTKTPVDPLLSRAVKDFAAARNRNRNAQAENGEQSTVVL